jgi:hypothetical protein
MFRQILSHQFVKSYFASRSPDTHHANLILRISNKWKPRRSSRKKIDPNDNSYCRYAVFTALGALGPDMDKSFSNPGPLRQPPPGLQYGPPQTTNSVYINWNQFCYQMLAKGEVEKIVVYPHADMVKVILYDGAIVSGVRAPMKQNNS